MHKIIFAVIVSLQMLAAVSASSSSLTENDDSVVHQPEIVNENLNPGNVQPFDLYDELSGSIGIDPETDLIETFGEYYSLTTRTEEGKGNVFFVDTTVILAEHRFYLEFTEPMDLCFFVYQGHDYPLGTGYYWLVDSVTVSVQPNLLWYSSGIRNFTLEEGHCYYVGVAWSGTATYSHGGEYPPITCSFGEFRTSGCINYTHYPIVPDFNHFCSGEKAMYQTIVTGESAGNQPAIPTDFTVSHNELELRASLSWINPSLQINGDPLTELTGVFVYRDSTQLADLTNVEIGEPYQYEDLTVPAAGLYIYQSIPYNSAGLGLPAFDSQWIGLDTPGLPGSLEAFPDTNYALSCSLAWTAPTEGGHGGYWPPGSWGGQKIYRDQYVIADLTGTNTYYVDTPADSGEYDYRVSYYNHSGEGPKLEVEEVQVGSSFIDTYYDIGGGENDFATLQEACEWLHYQNLQETIAFQVFNGTYPGGIDFDCGTMWGISEEHRIVITNAPFEKPYIVCDGDEEYAIEISDAPYCTVQGLEIIVETLGCAGIKTGGFDNDYLTIRNNHVTGPIYNSEDGIELGWSNQMEVIGNIVEGFERGIKTHFASNLLIVNNIVFNQYECGIYISDCDTVNIYYNSIYTNNRATLEPAYGSETTVLNNIVYNSGAGTSKYAYEIFSGFTGDPGVTASNSNCLYAPDCILVALPFYSLYLTTLEEWQQQSNMDLHSICLNPEFVNLTPDSIDLHLNSWSPCIGQGIPIEGILYDIDGDLRSPTNPCIGADEREFVSAIDPQVSAIIPDNPILYPPHPNPFNNRSVVSFSLERAGEVSLKIFDITGRSVGALHATPNKKWYSAGYHEVVWNAEDCASGVYFVRMVAGDFMQTQKLLLIK